MYCDIKNRNNFSIDMYKKGNLGVYVMDIETNEKKVTLTFEGPEEVRIMYNAVKNVIDNDHLLNPINTKERLYFKVDA